MAGDGSSPPPGAAARVGATPAALEAVARLVAERGPVLFFVSAGCCDGTCPMCFAVGDLLIGPNDVVLGTVDGCTVYVDGVHAGLWRHSSIVLDVAPGDAEGFSLPAGPGEHFVARVQVVEGAPADREGSAAAGP